MKATRLCLSMCVLLLGAACGDDDDDDDGETTEEGEHDHDGGEHSDEGGHEHDGGHEGTEHPDCLAISDACHDYDNHMPNEIHTCHAEIAHANDPVQCAAEKERCIALCEAAATDAGAH